MIAGVDLSALWAAVLAFAIVMYVLLDGFDLGVGILLPMVRDERRRAAVLGGLAPVWDGNESWLLFGGAALFAGFPRAFGVLLPAFYLPLMAMLLALVLRGAAFGFHSHAAGAGRRGWEFCFAAGSFTAAFAQGLILGAYVEGIRLAPGIGGLPAFAGGAFDWFTPFSVLAGAAAVFGYALLGAGWLVIRTEGAFRDWSRAMAGRVANVTILFILLLGAATALTQPVIGARWTTGNAGYGFLLLGVLLLAAWGGLCWALRHGPAWLPFTLAAALFLLVFGGLLASLFPYIVPFRLTFWAAAAAAEAQFFLLVGAAILVPLMVFHTAFVFASVRGKIGADDGDQATPVPLRRRGGTGSVPRAGRAGGG